MHQRTAGLAVLAFTYSILIVASCTFYALTGSDTGSYYWSWLLLSPVALWVWVVADWVAVEMFSTA
ncbi:hypothetical protein TBLA_0H03840 [Henningerozyma blattae CBS 6284]|uniref:Uncharacterized protein n=1 Tax=Henningerozyma blattae (strain ATCC 34711 / CBS 6284 / DSM 70876 / NBRC 10599 / NRRL Y-10934 / UCD 77-7) TaxID=1071380 RepID=I2H8G3_HENB6|nr:hypothetical protein TBLA_0H03840 [Tetrapisispora blattae CBS 6284]CCH62665.1 hypothetical protein TBLA_0H03840 [Tetrapisispora blattae CBS 6284]